MYPKSPGKSQVRVQVCAGSLRIILIPTPHEVQKPAQQRFPQPPESLVCRKAGRINQHLFPIWPQTPLPWDNPGSRNESRGGSAGEGREGPAGVQPRMPQVSCVHGLCLCVLVLQ